jgi:hypothetical protein
MTLRRGNLDDMSMSLHSLKQTDTIRSDPQLGPGVAKVEILAK